MLKKARLPTRPTPARQDAPFRGQGRSKRSGDAYSVRYGEPPSETRTSLADSFSILLKNSDEDEVSDTSEESRRW